MRQFLLFIISLLICSYTKVEEPFKINGKIDGANVDSLVFKYYRCEKDNTIIDTISVTNGAFTIKGIISPRSYAKLSIADKELDFFLDPGEMQLYLIKDSLEKFKLKGSQTQFDKEILDTQTKSLEEYLSEIKKQLSSEQSEQAKDILISKKDSIDNLLNDIYIAFITSHPTSHYSLDAISFLLINKMQNTDLLMRLFNGLSEKVRVSCSGKQIYNFILQRKESTLANISFLTALDKDGNLVKISDFEGKYILVDFWASWCVPCKKGFPHLNELYAKYKDKGLVVIGISIDRAADEQKWSSAIEKYNLSKWIHIWSYKNKGENNICNLHDWMQDASIPHYILIDKTGNVIKQWRGFDDQVAKEQYEMLQNIFDKP